MRWRWTTFGLAAAVLAASVGGAAVWLAGLVEKSAPEIANPFLPSGVADRGWPFIRGSDFDGHSPETQLADAWPVGGPPVVWRRALGEGFSSPVAGSGRIYTQYQDASGQFVVCLDAATGETVWQYRYDWPFELGEKYPGPRATPTLAHGKVFFAGPSGLVGCLSDRGRLVWSVNVTMQFGGEGTGFGYSCSPTVIDDLVILTVGGKGAAMVALNAHDGSLVWRSGDQSASYTPAFPITVDGQRQVVGYMENSVVGHDVATGQQLWVHELSKGYDEHAAWPIYHNGYLWLAAPFQVGSELLKLSGGQGASAVSIRTSKLMSNDVASSVLIGEHIYGFDLRESQTKPSRPSRGTFRCIDFHTGDVRWSQGDPEQRRRWPPRAALVDESPVPPDATAGKSSAPPGHASFLVADGKLILFNDTGELILARATPERYEELGRTTVLVDEICWTSPALHRGCVFVRNHREIACIYVGRPELFDTIGAARAEPASLRWNIELPTIATAMGIRASDRLSVPPLGQLARSFGVGLGIVAAATVVSGMANRRRQQKSLSRTLFVASTALAGVLAPLVFSRWLGEFIFTWPVALFALLVAVVEALPLAHDRQFNASQRWRSILVIVLFCAACAIYFYACRQLGLPAQWIFLAGFGAAVPLLAIAKACAARTPLPWSVDAILIIAAFSAFYWLSVALMLIRT